MTQFVGTLLISLLIAGSLVAWVRLIARCREGKPLVDWSPRRPVPWNGLHVLLGIVLYVMSVGAGAELALAWLRAGSPDVREADAPVATDPAPLPDARKTAALVLPAARTLPNAAAQEASQEMEKTQHPLIRLIVSGENPLFLVLALVAAVFIAPLTEEFFFRILLAGWLEARERRWRRLVPMLKHCPRGAIPIVGSALPFALAHARGASEDFDVDQVLATTVGTIVGSLVAWAVMIGVLRTAASASWQDLGLARGPLAHDARIGVQATLVILLPMYLIQFGLYALALKLKASGLIAETVAPDPIPIFLLSVVFGYLYYRTHRYAPSVVAHMTFNAAPLLMILLMPK